MQGQVLSRTLPAAEIVTANLFLHHFALEALARLGSRLPPECRVVHATEPARRRRHFVQGALHSVLALLGRVTWHDMRVSICAGFLGDELPLSADLEIHLKNHGYVGLTRVENGRVNACGLFRRGESVSGDYVLSSKLHPRRTLRPSQPPAYFNEATAFRTSSA